MSDMATERKLYMDTDLEKEISIDNDDRDNLPLHHEAFSHYEDTGDDEEGPSTWQTRSNRNVNSALPFTCPPPGLINQIMHVVTPLWNF
jgi:hypothetical protein